MAITKTAAKDTENLVLQGTLLPLMESFYSIQGEGFHTGKAAFFIRLAGCDVGCHWCDVKESWNREAHSLMHTKDIVEEALKRPSPTVIITGGEPTMYNLDLLTENLLEQGKQTHIETSGAYPLTGKWNWICLSPKKVKTPVSNVYNKADELKIVVYNKHDFQWAEENAEKVGKNCRLYLQPEWGRREEMLPLIIDYVKSNPKWEISLQVHKYMDVR